MNKIAILTGHAPDSKGDYSKWLPSEFDALKFQDPKKYAHVLNEIISTL
jgi:hypothetical protein